jgi:hypothetical protein
MLAAPVTKKSSLSLADFKRRKPLRSPMHMNMAFQGNLCMSPGNQPATTNNSRLGINRDRLRSEEAGTAAARWGLCFGLAPQLEDDETATADGSANAPTLRPPPRSTPSAADRHATATAELAAPHCRSFVEGGWSGGFGCSGMGNQRIDAADRPEELAAAELAAELHAGFGGVAAHEELAAAAELAAPEECATAAAERCGFTEGRAFAGTAPAAALRCATAAERCALTEGRAFAGTAPAAALRCATAAEGCAATATAELAAPEDRATATAEQRATFAATIAARLALRFAERRAIASAERSRRSSSHVLRSIQT